MSRKARHAMSRLGRPVDVRFPVADGDAGRLRTLRFDRVAGRPGLWRHPDNASIEVSPSFEGALANAWAWVSAQDARAGDASVRWRLLLDDGDPRASGGSAGGAAAVGLAYLLGLTQTKRALDQRTAISATVTPDGALGPVDQLPAKLTSNGGTGKDWRLLVVAAPDERSATEARQGDLPQVKPAADVRAAAALMVRPRVSRRGVLSALTAVIVIAGALTWYFVSDQSASQRQANLAQAQASAHRLASLASSLTARDPEAALHLSAAAYQADNASADARAALLQVIQADPRIEGFLGADGDPAVTRLASSADGSVAVSADAAGTAKAWRHGQQAPTVLSHGKAVNALAVSPDGSLVAVARGTSVTVTTAAGKPAPGWPSTGLRVAGGAVDTLAINDDATQLAVGTSYDDLYVWTRAGGTVSYVTTSLGTDAVASAMIFLPDGRLVTGTTALKRPGGAQDLSVWVTGTRSLTRTELTQPPVPELIYPGVRTLAVVGDNLLIAQTSVQIRPLDALDTTRMTLPIVDGIDALVPVDRTHVMVGVTPSLMFGIPPIGGAPATLPTTYTDYDLSTGKPVDAPFAAGAPSTSNTTSLVQAAAVGPNGTLLAGTSSGSLVYWRPASPPASEVLRIVPDPVNRSGVIVTRADGSVLSFDARSRKSKIIIPAGHHGPATGLAVTGATVFVGYLDGTVLRVNQGTDSAPATLLHLQTQAVSLAYEPKGDILAVADNDGVIAQYDAATGKLVRTLPHVHHATVPDIAFSPDGTHLASSDVKDSIAVQSVRGDDTRSIPVPSAGLLTWQSNQVLLAGSGPGDVYRIDLREKSRTPKQLAAPEETNILGGALSPTGNLLILASAAQEADLLDPATGRVLGRFATLDATRSGPRNSFAAAAWTAAFTPDGDDAVFGTAEGHLQVITVDLPALAARACALAPTAPVSSSVLTGANLRAAQDACR